MKTITSAQNPRLKAAVRLKTSRGRKIQRRIIIFGLRELQRAVQSGIKPLEVFMQPELLDASEADWVHSLEDGVTAVYELPWQLFKKLKYGDRQDGVVAVAPRPELELSQIRLPAVPLIVVLESIEKPGNIGAVLRSADGAAASALVLSDPQCDPLHPNCIRASQGTVFSLPLATATNQEVERWLAGQGVQLLLATDDGTCNYTDVDFNQSSAVVFGNEAEGLSDFWTKHKTARTISIPMRGTADSLNISVAAAVILYESQRQRNLHANP